MAKGIITTKYLEELGVDKETAQKIFAERGREIAEMNAERAALENELKEGKESFAKFTSELETLKADNANGEEWKEKWVTDFSRKRKIGTSETCSDVAEKEGFEPSRRLPDLHP